MKRQVIIVLAVCVLIGSAGAVFSQDNSFGLRVGLDLWRVTESGGAEDWQPKFTPGFSFGFFGENVLAPIFSIQTEITFLFSRGKLVDPADEDTYVELREFMGDVAFIPKFFFALDEGIDYFVYIAPSVGFGIIPSERATFSSEPEPGNWEELVVENWRYKANFSVLFGMGIEVHGFFLDIRYSLGLINRNEQAGITRKASRLMFATGYKF